MNQPSNKLPMTLEDQVCSLELSKKLKELNMKQESLFYWQTDYHPYGSTSIEDDGTATLLTKSELSKSNQTGYYSAFTVAELGEMLPTRWGELLLAQDNHCLITINKIQGDGNVIEWEIVYNERGRTPFTMRGENLPEPKFYQVFDESEANARAKILIYLLQNHLITL